MATEPSLTTRTIPIVPVSSGPVSGKIQMRATSGVFTRWRWAMVWLTQLIFYGTCWLEWNGRQAVLFHVVERKFYLFGLVLWPQDIIYLTAILIISALSLFLFTAVGGRLWCGYACPQTVYTEIFMWIERRIEGDRLARMRLDQAPWSAAKLARKSAKHGAWGAFALVTGFSFVGYFTPVRSLAQEALQLSFGPWEWFWVLFYAFATYGNAGWMREQVCKYMCPYARFQSALIDRDSLVIAYDTARGEPRGSRPRHADPAALGLGSCIDCTLCVQVCPTGIDIRKGLQNECIGCAACIDVCDGVMDKIGAPRGLIRYATENGVAGGWSRGRMLRRALRPRTWIYGGLLALAVAAFVTALATRAPFHADVIKDRGALAREVEGGDVENVYRVQLVNRGSGDARFTVTAAGLAGLGVDGAATLPLAAGESGQLALRLRLPAGARGGLSGGPSHPVQVRVTREDAAGTRDEVTVKAVFVVPR